MEKPTIKLPTDWTELEIHRFWNWMTETKKPYFTEHLGVAILNYLKKNVDIKNKMILDFGCGNGHLLSLFKNEKVSLFGLDFADSSIEIAKAKTLGQKNLKDLIFTQNLPSKFETNYFDVIFLIETIEHLNDTYMSSTLIEINRILKPGGVFFITTPFEEELNKNFAYCPFCNSMYHRVQHMNSFSISSLSKLLEMHEFKIVKAEGVKLGSYQNYLKFHMVNLVKKVLNKISFKFPLDDVNLVILASK